MSSVNPLVRVKDTRNGAEYNASLIYATRAGLTVLDKPTHDRYGRPIPGKQTPPELRRQPALTPPKSAPKKAAKNPAAEKSADIKES